MCPASVSSMAPVTSVAMISQLIKSAEYSMSAVSPAGMVIPKDPLSWVPAFSNTKGRSCGLGSPPPPEAMA